MRKLLSKKVCVCVCIGLGLGFMILVSIVCEVWCEMWMNGELVKKK